MRNLRLNYIKLKYVLVSFTFLFLFSQPTLSKDLIFEIEGNNYTDTDVILSLLDNVPKDMDQEYSNEIIKALNDSKLFSEVSVKFNDNKYTIIIKEFPSIDKIYFNNNTRLKDDELKNIADEINLTNYNTQLINLYLDEIKKIYQNFGYNNIQIEYSDEISDENNAVNLIIDINEGNITKINKILVDGNSLISSDDIKNIINSKTKTFRNIFANNNYKPLTLERDRIIILNYFKNNGYLDINVDVNIEYLKNNKVNIYFKIREGSVYSLSSISVNDKENFLSSTNLELINSKIENLLISGDNFSIKNIENLKDEISSIILDSGNDFFEIKTTDKINNYEVAVSFDILSVSPKYAKQINIVGNTRTFDYVIRRELNLIEGDAVYTNQIKKIRDKLNSLNLFETVKITEEVIDDNTINLIIAVEEKQTGTFNAGVSVGSLDGFSIVTGLRERNFYGTGRSLDALINTSKDKNQFKLITTDRLSYDNDINISYNINYKQEDFSNASSYKLDTFSSGVGIGYSLNKNLYHNLDFEYLIKNYKITNTSTVSNSILSSSGENISFLLKNNIRYSTLNQGFLSKSGNYLNYSNTIETPTSSNNGYLRNIINLKQYYSKNHNIFSIQTRLGNIFSLNNNDILTDDKFSLGGRWLRGFDNYGAGPRNSRTSYVGGNNIAVTKLDYSYEITNKSNFPIYFNLFNDYGLIWDNKTKPTHSDNNLRSSAGFGIKYYSPIGPIGFSWGFPLIDEDYDIKRMFLFSIGNID